MENTTIGDFLVFPKDGYEFDTHTEIQNEFIKRIAESGTDDAINWLLEFKGPNDFSYPRALRFEWKNDSSQYYIFELSKKPDFKDSYKKECSDNFVEIDNLEIGRKYFWRVNNSKSGFFYTKNNGIRFIRVDGALNVRDLGGNKIKQGLIFRGSDIDTYYTINDKGIKVLRDELKIKSELELRIETDGTRKSILGDGVKFAYMPYSAYERIFEDVQRNTICNIMEFLSHEENYPVYLHCFGGADRTGMIALFLRALVGEDDEFINVDYEITTLSSYAFGVAEGVDATGRRSRNGEYFLEFLNMLDKYAPGGTYGQKIRKFLIESGVTEETINKIISIIKM